MSELLTDIQKARNGEIITIPFKHKKLSRYIFIGKNLYHLIGGAGGSGKSAWVDLNYVINPALWIKKNGEEYDVKAKIVLRSMERSKKHRIAKWVCMKLYLDYGILIDVPSLLGWGVKKNKITDELYEKIKEAYRFIESLFDIIEVIDGVENPTGIFKQMQRDALSRGTLYYYKEVNGEDVFLKKRANKTVKASPKECPEATLYQSVYKPDDPNFIFVEVWDHLQAMKIERKYTNKQNLDKASEYARIGRDLFGMSQVMVNQMNRGISDTYRKVKTELLPQDSDFSGSSNMYNDCDMAGILFSPYKYNLDELKGWRINKCTNKKGINRFRSFHLLKNTYGPDNQIFGYQFVGENGLFREIPKPAEMNEGIYNSVSNPSCTEMITNYMNED